MLDEGRDEVVWIGSEPMADLKVVADVLGLTITYDAAGTIDPSIRPRVRAVLLPYDGKALGRAHRILRSLSEMNLLDYGILLGIVCNHLEQAYELRDGLLKVTGVAIPIFEESQAGFAKGLRAHDPGPSPSTVVPQLETGCEALQASDDILLRRAFHDATAIRVRQEHGGRSAGCRVFRVTVEGGHSGAEPYIAKIAPHASIESERAHYRQFVEDFIPFPFRAPFVFNRCLTGGTRAILVSMFVGRAQRIDTYLANDGNPHALMTSLFTDAMGGWRTHSEATTASIGRILVERQEAASKDPDSFEMTLLPQPDRLMATYEECTKQDPLLDDPQTLYERIRALPAVSYHYCISHGDLNIRNVFVRWHSTDAILIDFQQSGQNADPMARDLSKLDTSIALAARNSDTARDKKGELLPLDELDKLFKHPILPPNRFRVGDDARKAAIRQLRRHASGEGISNHEYELLTICHLLRFAVPPMEENDETRAFVSHRPRCYELAYRLLNDMAASH